MKNPHDVILRPVLTEASYEGIADKRYVFEVHKSANKTEIKLALEAIFKDIKVEKVNTQAPGPHLRPHPGDQKGLCDPHQGLQAHRVL